MRSRLDASTMRDFFSVESLPPPMVLAETASTNAVLAAQAQDGSVAPWQAVVAERQSAGRGRLGRTWESPAEVALLLSVFLPGPAAPEALPWVPLAAGLAIAAAIEQLCVEPDAVGAQPVAALKWPNDVLVSSDHPSLAGRKLAGILCEAAPGGVIIGVGINVDHTEAELPVPQAASLRMVTGREGLNRSELAGRLISQLHQQAQVLDQWGVAAVRENYRRQCATVGARVRAIVPAGADIEGTAIDIDEGGNLVVRDDEAVRTVSAADVIHLRGVDLLGGDHSRGDCSRDGRSRDAGTRDGCRNEGEG